MLMRHRKDHPAHRVYRGRDDEVSQAEPRGDPLSHTGDSRPSATTRYSSASASFSLGTLFFALPACLASPVELASPFALLRFLPFLAGVVSSTVTSAVSTHSRNATGAAS